MESCSAGCADKGIYVSSGLRRENCWLAISGSRGAVDAFGAFTVHMVLQEKARPSGRNTQEAAWLRLIWGV